MCDLKMYEIKATNGMYKCKPYLLFIFFLSESMSFLSVNITDEIALQEMCYMHFAEARNGYTVNQDGVQEGRQNMKF